ncbi:TrbC/VirB2 family protein [Sphingomonas sp. DT-204]|uniref:TrbC/VirB2 family protein n=1 Tax=Sphingomonas sp. DT-204 TaxID=3396166 RepID=UPI003F1A8E45
MIAPPVRPEATALGSAAESAARLLTGSLATSIAIICVAIIGYMTLTGRLPVRRGVTVIIGCFILFGAGTLSRAFLAVARQAPVREVPSMPVFTPSTAIAPLPKVPYDPYAGAAVPTRE